MNRADAVLVDEVADWLMSRALGATVVEDLLPGCCVRLRAAGVPLWRGHVAFNTLHPLFASRTVTWRHDSDLDVVDIPHHGTDPAGWLSSPLYHLVTTGLPYLRRRLVGLRAQADFPMLEELRDAGATDYLAFAVAFADHVPGEPDTDGIVGSWATDHPNGFGDADIRALTRIQTRLAVAFKIAIKEQIARNIAVAYLGRNAGERVLAGTIRRGDGEDIHAVIWFCDLRDSTPLSSSMPRAEFFELLNRFLECMAGAVLDHDGEVLRFIGDAALAIFPFDTDQETAPADAHPCTRALAAAEDAAQRVTALNAERAEDQKPPIDFGIGLHVGDLMYGNIGSPARIEFTVIGSAANQAARIESLCKTLDTRLLISDSFAALYQGELRSLGRHALRGVEGERELFTHPVLSAAK